MTQAKFVRSAIAEYGRNKAGQEQRRAERQAQLAGANAEISQLRQTLPLLDQQLSARQELADKGYFSKLRLLEYEQLRVEHIQNIEIQSARPAEAGAANERRGKCFLRISSEY